MRISPSFRIKAHVFTYHIYEKNNFSLFFIYTNGILLHKLCASACADWLFFMKKKWMVHAWRWFMLTHHCR